MKKDDCKKENIDVETIEAIRLHPSTAAKVLQQRYVKIKKNKDDLIAIKTMALLINEIAEGGIVNSMSRQFKDNRCSFSIDITTE
jgi:hypothetical protein